MQKNERRDWVDSTRIQNRLVHLQDIHNMLPNNRHANKRTLSARLLEETHAQNVLLSLPLLTSHRRLPSDTKRQLAAVVHVLRHDVAQRGALVRDDAASRTRLRSNDIRGRRCASHLIVRVSHAPIPHLSAHGVLVGHSLRPQHRPFLGLRSRAQVVALLQAQCGYSRCRHHCCCARYY